jgi:hypothetical protein
MEDAFYTSMSSVSQRKSYWVEEYLSVSWLISYVVRLFIHFVFCFVALKNIPHKVIWGQQKE